MTFVRSLAGISAATERDSGAGRPGAQAAPGERRSLPGIDDAPRTLVTGRRDFDVECLGWQVAHRRAHFYRDAQRTARMERPNSPFTFVTDGVASTLDKVRQVAGDKDIGVSGSTIVQQCLQAGFLDEIQIHLAPVLLGAGIRLFDHLGPRTTPLEVLRVVTTPDVTHLAYRVIK